MMRWIVATSLKFRILVVALAAGMMGLGFVQLRKMPVDVFPEFAPPRVEIQTACLGLSAGEVESLVTVPMENALNGVEGLETMRSKSLAQLSSIELLFKPGTDLFTARQLVSERMVAVTPTLPTWAAPPVMLQPVSSMGRVMKIGLTSDSRSIIEMSMISYWTIRAKLLEVPGVANVAIWGEQLQMLQVQVDPKRMQAHSVSLDQVMTETADALEVGLLQFSNGAVIGTDGQVTTPNQTIGVRHVLPIRTAADLAKVTVSTAGQTPLHLGDVADVVEGHQPLIGDAVIGGQPGVMLIVEKLPWANTIDVTNGVEQALKTLEPGLTGINVDPAIFRPASFIETAVDNLSRALLLGCLFVVLVLALFLFEWRTALISLVAIPLSIVAAGLVLYYRGATINTMVLAGLVIAVGVVVDDAIIDIENIMRRLRQARAEGSDRSTASIILDASLEVRSPIVYATMIIVAAAVPIFFLGGLTGAFFRPLALSYTLAVLASLLVALTVTPALALLLLARAPLDRRESPIVRWLKPAYGRVLDRVIRKPLVAFAATGAVLLFGLAALPALGQSLLPAFKERNVFMHFITAPGSSNDEEIRMIQNVSKELRQVPGVQTFGAHIGMAYLGDETAGVNFGELWISIDPKVDYDETIAKIEEVGKNYPGLLHNVYTYLRERTDEVLTGSGDAIVVRIYGEDLDQLRAKAAEVEQLMADTPGTADRHTDLEVDVPQVEVTVDLAKAEKFGVKPGDVRRASATLMAGEEVGDIFRDGKAYDIVVWSTPASRDSVADIENMPIDTPDGGHVRLGDVATVEVKTTPNVILHDGTQRYIDVGSDVRGRDLGAVVKDLDTKLGDVEFDRGYHAELLGEYAERQAAAQRILWFGLGAALLILVLLRLSFDSWRLAVLSFLTLPSALVGGVLAAYFFSERTISLGSLVGLLTVLGIAARNGILLISHYQHLERFEGHGFGKELVLRGSLDRLSPILMTTLATGLALVPLVALGDVPGHEIEHPMAVVIIGGLLTSTLLNLVIVPVLYLRFGRPRDHSPAPAAPEPNPPAPQPAPAG
ncbi:efflux RND transporter permease subunit [Catellatospora sp. KI3]|uniref:efflux RND transporter permease subunit n=1 Tax=Catellatospora sp. KI3 TaxID=3041620 RepID=UPI002482BC0F|nr:efflux RND transporter permease subunit [Catellatospora sp. KI3]MDI1462479.1 efflux RND transporter permease subunit [Catellatospora sp. KI3]